MTMISALRVLAVIAGFFTAVSVMADEPDVKEIMESLRDDLVEISDGLLTEDAERVSLAGARIANHAPVPKRERGIIAKELGSEMGKFKQFDELVHELSKSIEQAAKSEDFARMQTHYKEIVSACLECHTAYRERVSASLDAAGR
ncbi:MAG: hypothetical protein V3U76_10825 [Granulosicoccus sp.]